MIMINMLLFVDRFTIRTVIVLFLVGITAVDVNASGKSNFKQIIRHVNAGDYTWKVGK